MPELYDIASNITILLSTRASDNVTTIWRPIQEHVLDANSVNERERT